jgi:hypothetical protein
LIKKIGTHHGECVDNTGKWVYGESKKDWDLEQKSIIMCADDDDVCVCVCRNTLVIASK